MSEVLETHEVKESVADLLLWQRPAQSAAALLSGVALFVMVDVFNIGIMVLVGSVAILQLVVYRFTAFLQDKGIAFDNVDLKQKIVLTPEPSSVSAAVDVSGDMVRIVEESIKDLSLTSDYFRLLEGFSTLLFLSALGRVITLPVLLLACWCIAFTLPAIYMKNQAAIDRVVDRSMAVSEGLVNRGAGGSSGRRKVRAN